MNTMVRQVIFIFCSLKLFEEAAPEILKRISREEYENFIRSVHLAGETSISSVLTELTQAELALLHCTAYFPQENNGELITVAQAAAELKISAPAVSRTLKNLEHKGYISRNTDPADRRTVRISPTESGLVAMKKCIKQSMDIINETLSGFSDEELSMVMRLHCKFTQNMAKVISEKKKSLQKGTDNA